MERLDQAKLIFQWDWDLIMQTEHEKCLEMMFHLAASNNVFAMYPFVPLTQYGVKKIMKMTVFPLSKFFVFRFF